MKMIVLILLINIQAAYSSVKGEGGGDRVGNGGDVILCHEDKVDKYYVLDEYKAGFKLEIGGKDIPYTIKVSRALEKIRHPFPARYEAYVKIYTQFQATVTYTNAALPEIDDEMIYDYAGCTKIQPAYFKKESNGGYTYFIQKQIWNSLDNDQQAVLLLHEILYTEAIGLGTMTSASVRSANRLLFSSGEFDPIEFDDKFLLPIQYTGTFGQYTNQLQNAFSERIAINLLERNWSHHYSDKTMTNKLRVLQARFRSNSLIARYVEEHISRIQALSR